MFALTRFSQMDPRWMGKQLGADPTLTIGSHGCLVTNLAMVATGFGFDVTPAVLNDLLVRLGPGAGFQGGLVIPASLPRALPGMIYRRYVSARASPAPVAEIRATLAASLPVIVEVDYAPTPGLQTHWLVLTGLSNGDFLAQDPFPYPPEPQEVPLTRSRYGFAGSLEAIITAALWLEGPRPVVGKPAGAISVFTSADQLALRSQPAIDSGNLIKRYPLQTELFSLELTEATLLKVGAVNQWLRVQDATGAQGYAAAWYLETHLAEPAPLPQGSGQLRLYTAADALALRSFPVVGPDNLIKRLALGSELLVVEEKAGALAKVGMQNQWIKVRDATGQQGYAAGWYLNTQAPLPLGPGTPPGSPPQGILLVFASLPGLALRSQPRIAPETLILRLEKGDMLQVLEPRDAALKKIGTAGEWLNVRSAGGQAGYVAAWYVIRLG